VQATGEATDEGSVTLVALELTDVHSCRVKVPIVREDDAPHLCDEFVGQWHR
jgi:hypothetical protein